eukprot:528890_1
MSMIKINGQHKYLVSRTRLIAPGFCYHIDQTTIQTINSSNSMQTHVQSDNQPNQPPIDTYVAMLYLLMVGSDLNTKKERFLINNPDLLNSKTTPISMGSSHKNLCFFKMKNLIDNYFNLVELNDESLTIVTTDRFRQVNHNIPNLNDIPIQYP